MKLRTMLTNGLLVFLLAGCGIPANLAAPAINQSTGPQLALVTSDPHAPATPTPFQPVGEDGKVVQEAATQTPAPGAGGAAPSASPAPTVYSGTPTTVPYINRISRPDGTVNILILGSDYRPDAGYRTDVMMLLSLNTKKGTANLVSFPRDLYVDIPGWTMQRLNTAQAHGGFALTQQTFEENFGVHPDYYIMTNFQGFKGIIDTLGGVDVVATKSLSDKCDLPQKVRGYCNVSPGTVHMNGATALWYVRARYSTSDFDRTRRAQEVIKAVFLKLIGLNGITRASEIYTMFASSVETNLNLTTIGTLLPLASKMIDLGSLKQYAVGTAEVTSWITPEGADVLVPNKDLIFNTIISKACYGQ